MSETVYGPNNSDAEFQLAQSRSGEYECTLFSNEISRRNLELRNLYDEVELLLGKIKQQQGYKRINEMQFELEKIQSDIIDISAKQASTSNGLRG